MKHDDRFRVFVEQLRDGEIKPLDETLEPEFMEIEEPDLRFVSPIVVKGETYLAEQELIIRFDHIQAAEEIPCRICNEPVRIETHIRDHYQSIPMNEIEGGIFDFRDLLRETILLEVPPFIECQAAGCPERTHLKRYFKPETPSSDKRSDTDEQTYNPFADL